MNANNPVNNILDRLDNCVSVIAAKIRFTGGSVSKIRYIVS